MAGLLKTVIGRERTIIAITVRTMPFTYRRAILRLESSCSKATDSSGETQVNKSTVHLQKLKFGPDLKYFIRDTQHISELQYEVNPVPYILNSALHGKGKRVYFEVYGCQMNVNDTEIIWSILKNSGYKKTVDFKEADVILIITCAIREGAERKVWNKLQHFIALKKARTLKKSKAQLKIGILGCMAERLKHIVLEKEQFVDVVAGPDSYRDLPRLLSLTDNDQSAVNVLLSLEETYADIMPVRLNEDAVTAFISIMRGCDNMCTYCIVPFTRGRERSRPISSILEEVRTLSQNGVKEVTLLGQNVNSYCDRTADISYGGLPATEETHMSRGFCTVYKSKSGGLRFADLLDHVSKVDPEMRIRFTSPHPKDFPDEVLELIRERKNICCALHLPVQSGNNRILECMRRGYTREAYLDLIHHVKTIVPDVKLSSDFICGFCSETEEEFEDTLSLMKEVNFNMAYMFSYNMREKTTAHRRFADDIPPEVKQDRLVRMITLQQKIAQRLNKAEIGREQLILVEGPSKRSTDHLVGRNDGHTKVIIPHCKIPQAPNSSELKYTSPGDYVVVKIHDSSSVVLKGDPLYHSSISDFSPFVHTRSVSA